MAHFSKAEILHFLRSNPVMNIATILDDKPLASVLLFTVSDDFIFHFCTRKNSFKSLALLKNPAISFSVWKFKEMLVQVDGIASTLADDEKNAVFNLLAQSALTLEDFWPPLFQFPKDEYIIFRISPTWIRAFDLQLQTIRGDEEQETVLDMKNLSL